MRPKGSPQESERHRRRAIASPKNGGQPREIAGIVGVDRTLRSRGTCN
ncbi:MAG: hypothetical protein ACE5K8_02215 [Candidatus Zixiibacteriota bacterium]